MQQLIPDKYKNKYNKEYDNFEGWKKTRNISLVTEDVVIAYFYELVSLILYELCFCSVCD